jgi:hypothetical protein
VQERAAAVLGDFGLGELATKLPEELSGATLMAAADRTGAALVVATHDLAISGTLPEVWRIDHGHLDTAAHGMV